MVTTTERRRMMLVCLTTLLVQNVNAYLSPSASSASSSLSLLSSSITSNNAMHIRKRQSSMIQNMIFNGNTNTNNSNNSNNSNNNEDEGIILSSTFMKDKASLLESAFDAMDDRDKYDAVLTGLCSKILDNQGRNTNNNNNAAANAANAEGGGDDDVMNGNMNNNNNNYNAAAAANVVDEIASDATLTPTQLAMKTMKDPIRLLEEMNASRVKASSRSLMALVDATTTTNDPRTIAKVLSLALQNGALNYYGSLQSTMTYLPPTPTSKVPNKSNLTRQQRLDKLQDVPTDDRATEISAALGTLGIIGFSFILQGIGNGLGLDDLTFYTSLLSSGIIGILIIDNFFDAIQGFTSFVVKMNAEKLPDAVKNVNGPEKENMPLELGSGKVTGTIVRGLTRIWSVDTERECQCEAAALFAAYSLGLPCFSFRPNALEAAVMLYESQNNDEQDDNDKKRNNEIDSLLSDTGIMKMLIWLMAPVAIESSFHPQLIASDPREARGFLQRLKDKAAIFDAEDVIEGILQTETRGEEEIEDLLKWSYAEADLMLRQNKAVVTELTERLIGGASTVGDCVAVLEEW